MLISVIFTIIFLVQLHKTVSLNRKILSLIALGVYLTITIGDLFWLENIENISFHFSDPSLYHSKIIGLNFEQVLQIKSSNTFYYIINWFYNEIWADPTVISLLLKINNALITVCIYLLATRKLERITYIDFLILFNPYTIMTLIRNVRDVYIILFVLVILMGLGVFKENRVNALWTWLSILLLSITRSVLLIPIMIIYWMQNKDKFTKRTRSIFYIFTVFIVIAFNTKIISIVANQTLSALHYVGEWNESTEFLRPMLDGNLSFSMGIFLLTRLSIGTISFFFTPHPVNFTFKWIESMTETGSSGIYTGIDNLLISLGSVFNYILVLPILIAFWANYKKVNKYIFIFVIIYTILYVVSYLGVTDIRNRNIAIFFILLAVLFPQERIKMKPIYYYITICIFLGLIFVKA